jgi:hypothetical protein
MCCRYDNARPGPPSWSSTEGGPAARQGLGYGVHGEQTHISSEPGCVERARCVPSVRAFVCMKPMTFLKRNTGNNNYLLNFENVFF